jgi:DNA-binding beta-propeller fold protein YncE
VVMVNPEAGTVSVFDTATNARLAELRSAREPSAVVIHPDGKRAYVANRADATVVKIDDLDGTPRVSSRWRSAPSPPAWRCRRPARPCTSPSGPRAGSR